MIVVIVVMWIDKRGHWHALVHKMFDPPDQGPLGLWSGGHLYSVDGTKWEPLQRAYNTTFSLVGGELTHPSLLSSTSIQFIDSGRLPCNKK